MGREVPLGRVGRAEEVANVIASLASSAASCVTGTSINLDGVTSGVLQGVLTFRRPRGEVSGSAEAGAGDAA